MADIYSEHFAVQSTATVPPPTSIGDPRTKVAPGKGMSKVVRKVCHLNLLTLGSQTDGGVDTIRAFSMKSGDRLWSLELSNTAFIDTGTLLADIGLYAVNDTHTGAEADMDLFADAESLEAANEDLDVFLHDSILEGHDRGKMLWELLAIGAGTDTTDPHVDYDMVLTVTSGTAVTTGGELTLIAEYTPTGS